MPGAPQGDAHTAGHRADVKFDPCGVA